MKQFLSTLIALTAFVINVHAQTVTIDPFTSGTIITTNAIENNSYNQIKDKQNAIEALQATTVATVNFINDWHKKIYKGLTEISTTVNSAYQLVDCAEILADIVKIENEMLQEAQDNPLALAFVVKMQKEMVVKAIAYYNEINNVILKSKDDKLLMNAGERLDLINNVRDNLRCLRAMAWSAKYKVKLVVMNGILQTINPFSNIVNQDAKIVKDILKTWKY